jgi:hypothetical protein
VAAAVEDRLIQHNPVAALPLPKVVRKEMRFVTHEDLWKLADTIDQRYRAFVLLGGYGGLRLGEMLALRWTASTFLDNGFTWPRPSSISMVTRRSAHRRQQPPFSRSPSLEVSAPNCNRWRPRIAAQKTSSFSHPTATRFEPGFSIDGSGFLPSKMRDCHRSEFTTFATRRSRSGSPKGPTPSRSPSSQATPRCRSCSIATATFTRTRTTASSRRSNAASSRSAPESSATRYTFSPRSWPNRSCRQRCYARSVVDRRELTGDPSRRTRAVRGGLISGAGVVGAGLSMGM